MSFTLFTSLFLLFREGLTPIKIVFQERPQPRSYYKHRLSHRRNSSYLLQRKMFYSGKQPAYCKSRHSKLKKLEY